jgi:hypothetical protein
MMPGMAYPDSFHRLVIMGTVYSDIWNTTLTIAPDETAVEVVEPTEALVTAVANAVAAWYPDGTGTGLRASQSHKLTGIKLNRIDTAGHYQDGVTHEHLFSSPIAGAFSANPPAQLATVLSLRTAVERGQASKGRMYLPPCEGFTSVDVTTGIATIANAQRVATAGAALIDAINDAYNAAFPDFSAMEVAVGSNAGSGLFRRVTRVSVGRVPDTMRSRRSSLSELPEYVDVPA